MDTALFAAPVLGLVAALLLHRGVTTRETILLAHGAIDRGMHGAGVRATFARPGANPVWRAVPVGAFDIVRDEVVTGWPIPTTVRRESPEIRIQLYARSDAGPRSATEAERPFVEAVEVALPVDDHAAGAREQLELPARTASYWALATNAALCWIAVHVILTALIQATRFVAWRIEVRRQRRRRYAARAGVCLHCGYDVRASVWSERCPECGGLLD